jgi:hypothetical protein
MEKLEVTLTDPQALALAQMVKRITWSDMRQLSADDDEAYAMKDAVIALQAALAAVGYAPR